MSRTRAVWGILLCLAMVATAPAFASTFVGGSGSDTVVRSVRDASGNIYVAGNTSSTDFPVTPGVHGPTYHGGSNDLFVAKFDSSLTTLLAATYVGGSAEDQYPNLAIDSAGNIWVAGRTMSTDIPVTAGAYQPSKKPDYDFFVIKLDSNLTTVLAATYLGGSKIDSWGSTFMGINSAGNPVLAGRSTSSDFPTTAGAYDTTYNDYAPDHGDAVVAELSSDLTSLLASTFVGGALWDEPRGFHIDSDDTVLVVGVTTNSTYYGAFYPTTAGAYATCPNTLSGGEAFVSRLSADLSTLVASTCIGQHSAVDLASGVKTAADGSVVVVGRTYGTGFPVTAGAFDTTLSGTEDAFLVRFDSGLTTLEASTYLGGSGSEGPGEIWIDPTGAIHLSGSTDGSDFPTTVDGADTVLDGARDGYHVRLDADLTNLEYGTFIGGSDEDVAYGAFAVGTQIHVRGWTRSADFPTTPGAYDESYNGATDGFITRAGSLQIPQVPTNSVRVRWVMAALLLALLSFAAWRAPVRKGR